MTLIKTTIAPIHSELSMCSFLLSALLTVVYLILTTVWGRSSFCRSGNRIIYIKSSSKFPYSSLHCRGRIGILIFFLISILQLSIQEQEQIVKYSLKCPTYPHSPWLCSVWAGPSFGPFLQPAHTTHIAPGQGCGEGGKSLGPRNRGWKSTGWGG